MKRVNDRYLKKIICVIFGLIFVISTYLIVINIRHYQALSSSVMVSEADLNYTNFKKNVNDIEDRLNRYANNTSFKKTLNVLKNGGVFRLIPKTELTYYDLYVLNDYFINDIINDCWMANIKELNKNKTNDQMVNLLVNNSGYLDRHFLDNGIILYDSYSENNIQNDYEMILNNYLSFSNIILSVMES